MIYSVKKDKNLIFDVGMHRGEDTSFYLQKGFRVVAFEANPELVGFCKTIFEEYIKNKKLVIVEGAIVNTSSLDPGQRKVPFYVNTDVSVWGTASEQWKERNSRLGTSSNRVEVDVIDFSEIIREYGVPYYMKIDIEGYDMICVRSLEQFSERPDYISIESDKTKLSNIKSEIDYLVDLGYSAFQAVEQSSIPYFQRSPYPAREGAFCEHYFERGSSGMFGRELSFNWKSKNEILTLYYFIWLGYKLLGDDGLMTKWRFAGADKLKKGVRKAINYFTKAPVPGWYDTHAKLNVLTKVQ